MSYQKFEKNGVEYTLFLGMHIRSSCSMIEESGQLYAFLSKRIRWLQRNGKFFLDIPFVKDNLTKGEGRLFDCYAWNDLILTAEAVRVNFWKVLTRRGLDYMPKFLEKHPAVVAAYEKSTWDSYTSLYAKQKKK